MRAEAPTFNSVNALNGDKAGGSAWWQANSEADNFCAELDGLRELQTRVGELEDELREAKQRAEDLWRENQQLRTRLARAETARDTANLKGGVA